MDIIVTGVVVTGLLAACVAIYKYREGRRAARRAAGHAPETQTTGNMTGRHPPPGARPLFHIRYREDFGPVVRRDIFPIRPYATEEGVRAWCYLMGELRLFKFDQIEAVKEIDSGRDIMARGLWLWCGLPEPSRAFADEHPDALTQSPWPEAPGAPQFRITFSPPGGVRRTVEVSVLRWGSNRRTFAGQTWPERETVAIDWADMHEVTNLETGEMLNRSHFWRAVLAHRQDEAVPWYVIYADALPMACAVVRACQHAAGRFLTKDIQHLNAALQGLGMAPIDVEDWNNVRACAREPSRELTDAEAAAFVACMHAIAEGRPAATAAKLQKASSIYSARD